MSRLKIDDLNFCESRLPNQCEVKGGVASVDFDSSADAAFSAGVAAIPVSNGIIVVGVATGSAAGAGAGAAGVGDSAFAFTDTSAVAI